jgi:hypothetical protein
MHFSFVAGTSREFFGAPFNPTSDASSLDSLKFSLIPAGLCLHTACIHQVVVPLSTKGDTCVDCDA